MKILELLSTDLEIVEEHIEHLLGDYHRINEELQVVARQEEEARTLAHDLRRLISELPEAGN